jgi:hypothetical protein
MRLEQNQSSIDLSMAGANFTTNGYNQRGRGGHHASSHGFNSSFGRNSSNNTSQPYRGRGRFNSSAHGSSFSHQANRPKFQVCNRFGHIALKGYNRFNEAYSRESRDQSSDPQAYLTTSSFSGDLNWYPDSASTHHVTPNLTNLNISAKEYMGTDQIRVGKR